MIWKSVLFFFLASVICYVTLADVEHLKNRVRRRVLFTKSSKYFFRFNGKLVSLNYTNVVNFGYSVRMNWDLPHDLSKRYQFFKRDIHTEVDDVNDEVASQGFSCIIKHVCQMFSGIEDQDSCSFFCQIGRIISGEQGMEGNFFRNILTKCAYYNDVCPHHLPAEGVVFYKENYPFDLNYNE